MPQCLGLLGSVRQNYNHPDIVKENCHANEFGQLCNLKLESNPTDLPSVLIAL